MKNTRKSHPKHDLTNEKFGTLTPVENDIRKVEYCERNNIELKIIKYCDDYDLYDVLY